MGHRRIHVSRADTVEGDAAAGVLRSKRSCETDEPVLRRRVGGDESPAFKTRSRGDRDDCTRAAREHGRQSGAYQVIGAVEVGGDDAPPGVLVSVDEFPGDRDPGRVYKDVADAELILALTNGGAACVFIGDVGNQAYPGRSQPILDLVHLVGFADQRRNASPLCDEGARDRGSDPLPRAADQHDPALERPATRTDACVVHRLHDARSPHRPPDSVLDSLLGIWLASDDPQATMSQWSRGRQGCCLFRGGTC